MTDLVSSADIEERPPPNPVDVAAVRKLAEDLYRLQLRQLKAATEVSRIGKEIDVLETKVIPETMRKAGMVEYPLNALYMLRLEKFAHGSVKKADEPTAWAWMRGNGFAADVKRIFTIAFGRGEAKTALKFEKALTRRKVPVNWSVADDVHGATLKKFIKRRVELEDCGKVPPEKRIPRDLFGVYTGTRAVLIGPESKEKK